MEALILKALEDQKESNPVIRVWKSTHDLFSSRAANVLARSIVQQQSSVREALERTFIGPGTKLALLTRAAVAIQASTYFPADQMIGTDETILQRLDWMVSEVLSPPLLNEAYFMAVSTLILSKGAEKLTVCQENVRDYVRTDKRLGDPRLAVNRPHWSQMQPEAERLFLSWLARDSISFFLNTILPDTSENRLRKEFWLRYAGQIRDFQVAVSENDSWKLKAVKEDRLRGFARVAHATTSAFLMQFDGYGEQFVIVEFSETGNAAYIYKREMFETTNVNFRTPQFDLARHLKHKSFVDRIIHNGQWWRGATQRLAELGIRP